MDDYLSSPMEQLKKAAAENPDIIVAGNGVVTKSLMRDFATTVTNHGESLRQRLREIYGDDERYKEHHTGFARALVEYGSIIIRRVPIKDDILFVASPLRME